MVLFGQDGCFRAKVVVIGQKWLYLRKSESIRVKVVVVGQSFCVRGKVAVIGQKWLCSRKNGSIRAKVVEFEQK